MYGEKCVLFFEFPLRAMTVIILNGLQQFCLSNHMLVNEIKTKVMVFGNPTTSRIYFNTKIIEEMKDYKYLGNIISSIKSPNHDALKKTYQILCDKARTH